MALRASSIDIASAGAPSSWRTYPTSMGGATPCEVAFRKDREQQPQGRNTSPIPRGRIARIKVRVAAARRRVQVDGRVDDERPLGYRPCGQQEEDLPDLKIARQTVRAQAQRAGGGGRPSLVK